MKSNESLKKGKFFVGKNNFGRIIGEKGKTKLQIEKDTNCRITVPKNQYGHLIGIEGTEENIQKCKKSILKIPGVLLPKTFPPTHIISARLGEVKQFQQIVHRIMKLYPDFKKDNADFEKWKFKKLFISPQKFHFTLFYLTLKDEKEELLVRKLLVEKISKIAKALFVGTKNTSIQFEGIKCFSDDIKNPKTTRVLYLSPRKDSTTTGLLIKLNGLLKEFFKKNGIGNAFPYPFVLHSTILNSKYLYDKKTQHYDATRIVASLYKDQIGSKNVVDGIRNEKFFLQSLELSELGTSRSNEYYKGFKCFEFH